MTDNNKKLQNEAADNSAASSTMNSSIPSEWIAASDVEALVQKAVAAHTEKLLSQLGASRSNPDDAGEVKFAEHLALAIAQLSDQGTGRKRIAPEVIATRKEARDDMEDAIMAARKARNEGGEAPLYELRHKVYLEEVLVDPIWIDKDHTQQPTQIEWWSIPNEAMSPVNETAQRIHALFMESIGEPTQGALPENLRVTAGGLVVIGSGRQAAERPHVGQPRPSSPELSIRGRTQRTKTVNILGTVAPAAESTL